MNLDTFSRIHGCWLVNNSKIKPSMIELLLYRGRLMLMNFRDEIAIDLNLHIVLGDFED